MLRAPTADRRNVLLEILIPIVIGEFFSGLDRAPRENEYATSGAVCFTVGHTGMIDIARSVFRDVSIYHRRFPRPKEILTFIARHLFECRWSPNIFKNARAFRNPLFGKEAFTG